MMLRGISIIVVGFYFLSLSCPVYRLYASQTFLGQEESGDSMMPPVIGRPPAPGPPDTMLDEDPIPAYPSPSPDIAMSEIESKSELPRDLNYMAPVKDDLSIQNIEEIRQTVCKALEIGHCDSLGLWGPLLRDMNFFNDLLTSLERNQKSLRPLKSFRLDRTIPNSIELKKYFKENTNIDFDPEIESKYYIDRLKMLCERLRFPAIAICFQGVFNDRIIEYLGPALPHMMGLSLMDDAITDHGLRILSSIFVDRPCKLQSLNLNQNSITDCGIIFLSKIIAGLKHLDLSQNKIAGQGLINIALSFGQLTHLDLSYNTISSEAVRSIAAHGKKITHLNVSHNCITFSALDGEPSLLSMAPRLIELNINSNKIEDSGMTKLAENLVRFSNLTTLICYDNHADILSSLTITYILLASEYPKLLTLHWFHPRSSLGHNMGVIKHTLHELMTIKNNHGPQSEEYRSFRTEKLPLIAKKLAKAKAAKIRQSHGSKLYEKKS